MATSLTRSAAVVGIAALVSSLPLAAVSAAPATARSTQLGSSASPVSVLVSRGGHVSMVTGPKGMTSTVRRGPDAALPRFARLASSTIPGVRYAVGARSVTAKATVKITGSFSVTNMPTRTNVRPYVIACHGGTTFGITCGAWGAYLTYAKGTRSKGTFTFGHIPTSPTGWRIGMVLFDGPVNAGYTPTGPSVLVAKAGSSVAVKHGVSMHWVAPNLPVKFQVTGAPTGYSFLVSIVACPPSVTAAQLDLFVGSDSCALAGGVNFKTVGIYAAPGSWKIWLYYEPYSSTSDVLISDAVFASHFSLVGPTVTVTSTKTPASASTSSPYLRPSVSASVTSKLPKGTFLAFLGFIDPATNTANAEGFLDPRPDKVSRFQAFLDPGTWEPQAYVIPALSFPMLAEAVYAAGYVRTLAPPAATSSVTPTRTGAWTMHGMAPSVAGNVSVSGVTDTTDETGKLNAMRETTVVVCPGTPTFTLLCPNRLEVSPSQLLGGTFLLYGLQAGGSMAFAYMTLDGGYVVGTPVTVAPSGALTDVVLTAPYTPPSVYGDIAVTGDVQGKLRSMWLQACPSSEAFAPDCAGGLSESVFLINYVFPPSSGDFSVGYAIDLPDGSWNLAPVGRTSLLSPGSTLGPTHLEVVGTSNPVVDLTASV